MHGWLIIFGLASMSSGVWGNTVQSPAALFASGIFGVLFVLALVAKVVRGEAC